MRSSVSYAAFIALGIGAAIGAIACINVLRLTPDIDRAGVAENVYRFSPVRARAPDPLRFHGTDERISVENYIEMIRFYQTLIRHAVRGN